jgi:hypothetical protein
MCVEAELLRRVEAAEEVEIETRRRTGAARRTITWIVADGGHIYVRPVRGPGRKWYQRLRAAPEGAIYVAGTRTPPPKACLELTRAVPALSIG